MQDQAAITPAIVFEPDGYRTDGQRLMGRQAAGNGFLRAAVAAAKGRPLVGATPSKASAQVFARTVAEIDPAAKGQWLPPGRNDLLSKIGHLYMPGPTLGDLARQRLRAGPAAWSLTGITHTTASHGAMDSIVDLLAAPVMPWDALVCTSSAVLSTVRMVLDAQADYLRWRFGPQVARTQPQLPVIPLGVHCGDFEVDPGRRKTAREKLGIAEDYVVALFVGRLSFHAKAHPHAMYMGLQAAARSSGRKLVLVQCGWFANAAIETAFREGTAACPDVRCLFTDGRDEVTRLDSWAAADLFILLSDNIQETFGLSPIEAMAAGLPVVVTDWDGYKDTVRDGVDGFRVPTWMPCPGTGTELARVHESGEVNYDVYCGLACQHVAVDPQVLGERLTRLVSDSALRRSMGEAGRKRAREQFDWAIVYQRYQALWAELDRLRAHGRAAGQAGVAPRVAPGRLDPFTAFSHYPTAHVTLDTRVSLREGDAAAAYCDLVSQSLYSYGAMMLPGSAMLERVWPALASAPLDVRAFARIAELGDAAALRAVAVLAKMGLVELAGGGTLP